MGALKPLRSLGAASLLAATLWPLPAPSAEEAGANVYIAAATVRMRAPVAGDFVAAGGRVTVDQSIGDDAVIAGGTVTLAAPVGGDLRVAGGTLNVSGPIKGEVIAVGGTITFPQGVAVSGRAWMAGSELDLNGKFAGGVKLFGRSVRLAGEYGGDIDITAQEIDVAPGTTIRGMLRYAAPEELTLDPSVKVERGLARTPHQFEHWREHERRWRHWPWFAGTFFLIGLWAIGALLVFVFPGLTRAATDSLAQRPLASLLIGIGLLFALPPLVIVLVATVIGIPLAVVLLAAYLLLLPIGYLTSALGIGDRILWAISASRLERPGWRVVFLAIALVLLALVMWVPFAGIFIVLLAFLFGIGAWARAVFQRFSLAT